MSNSVTSIRLSEKAIKQLDELTETYEVSRSGIIRFAINEFYKEHTNE